MSLQTVKNGKLEYLTAQNIAVSHCFTTRRGGVSSGIFDSLNIALHGGDSEENVAKNLEILSKAIGFDLNKLVLTRQIHSDIVRVVTDADHIGIDHHAYPNCDALVTNTPGTALMVYTADCTPILLHDPVTGAVGAAHAGWRGTAANIAGKTVQAMVDAFGCKPENICAAIGPNIGQCCFETDSEVPEAMIEALGRSAVIHIRHKKNKYYVNLKAINAQFLKDAGVKNIEISEECTMCQHDRFWSHRYTKGKRGSQGAIIICKEATP